MAIFLEDKNLLFIHIPKTGGESITSWLKTNFNGKEVGWKHSTIDDINFSCYTYSFAVVRHPYDRIISWYKHLVRELHTKGSKRNLETRKIVKLCEAQDGINSYVDYCLNDSSPHYLIWKPQSFFINKNTEILRFENLIENFKFIQIKLDCFKKLVHVNASNNVDISLSNTSKKILKKVYEKDFIEFNYSDKL